MHSQVEEEEIQFDTKGMKGLRKSIAISVEDAEALAVVQDLDEEPEVGAELQHFTATTTAAAAAAAAAAATTTVTATATTITTTTSYPTQYHEDVGIRESLIMHEQALNVRKSIVLRKSIRSASYSTRAHARSRP